MDFIASTGETELEEDTAKMVPNHNFNPGDAFASATNFVDIFFATDSSDEFNGFSAAWTRTDSSE